MNDIDIKHNPITGIDWKLAITENTFSPELSKEIDIHFRDFIDKVKSGELKITKNTQSVAGVLFFPDCSRWQEVVSRLFTSSDLVPEYNIGMRDYMVQLELSCTPPRKQYVWHCDVDRKQATGVCYWRQGEDGTTIRSGKTNVKVGFKHNRALWFCNVHEEDYKKDFKTKNNPLIPWHTFGNNTDKWRFTININYIPQRLIGQIVDKKRDQFIYWLNNKKPMWKQHYLG